MISLKRTLKVETSPKDFSQKIKTGAVENSHNVLSCKRVNGRGEISYYLPKWTETDIAEISMMNSMGIL